MESYLEAGAAKIGLREVALSPATMETGRTRNSRRDPKTWKGRPKRGYWQCTILPELDGGRGRDRNDSQVALRRYMARGEKDTHLLGNTFDSETPEVVDQVSGTRETSAGRKYTSGRRMARSERMVAMGNTPAAIIGASKC